MSRREHKAYRVGCSGLVLVVVLVTGLVEFVATFTPAWKATADIVLYLLWGAIGMDLIFLLEPYDRYLRRYRERAASLESKQES
jgi:hypothetical protein